MYGYRCEYCEGTVQPRIVKREAFKHRDGFVILEDVTIFFMGFMLLQLERNPLKEPNKFRSLI
ncbi:MAG: hypothetical protein V7K50_30475 [Nostoc sp.]|uniref:hypothetical protein n=1 Tax=Nostoc sp. TaxID=1180 RepID=UPI002FF99BDC